MKKIALGIMSALLVLMSACVKMDEMVYSEDMDVNIEGYVFDGITEVPLKGAEVTGSFGKEKSDADGFYSIEGLEMGDYRFEIAAEGYLTKVLTESFKEMEDAFKGNELSFVLETEMFKKTEGISTQLVKVSGPTKQALSDMPYVIELSEEFKERFIYGRTDANGMIVDTVPDDAFTIKVDTVIDRISYSCNQSVANPNAVQKSYEVALTDLDVEPLYVSSTNVVDEEGNMVEDFEPANAVVVKFNSVINQDESIVELYKAVSGSYYLLKSEVVYSDGGKTLTVKPYDGQFAEGYTYKLSVNAQASADENSTYVSNFEFTTSTTIISSLAKPKVFSLKSPDLIQEYTTSIDFQITVDEKSEFIEIYGRYDNELEFVEMNNEMIFNWANEENGIVRINNFRFSSLPGIEVPAGGLFSENRNFEIIIRSKVYNNGKWIISEFSDPITIYNTMAVN